MRFEPLVSVIIPTYNRAGKLKRSIKSVLNQTYENFELIVVDDASKDDTETKVNSFDDSRIKYIKHDKNKGGGASRNTGIKLSEGKYIAFLDDDDIWLPIKLEKQIKKFSLLPNIFGAVYSYHYEIDDYTGHLKYFSGSRFRGDVYKRLLRGWCAASTSLFVIRSECFENVGTFDERLESFQDYDLWIRLSKQYYFDYVPKPLVVRNIHSLSQLSKDPKKRKSGLKLFLQKWGEQIENETGQPIHEVLQKHFSEIYLNEIEKSMENWGRKKALYHASKTLFKYGISLKKLLRVMTLLIGGASLHRDIEAIWDRIKKRRVIIRKN